jgi:hypothetical protein
MDMRRIVAVLAEEIEPQIQDSVWTLTPSDRALAFEAVAGLLERDVVGPPNVQEALPQIKRPEHSREAGFPLLREFRRVIGLVMRVIATPVTRDSEC